MSLKSNEEIGCVGRDGRGCYEEMGPVKFKLYRTSIASHNKNNNILTSCNKN